MVFPNGDSDGESASFSGFAFNGYFAFVGIDDKFNDTQAQSATLGFSGKRVIDLVEAVENPSYMSAGKTNPVIRNREADVIAFGKDLQSDLFLVAGVFAGVIEKVDKDGDHRIVVG